MSIKNTASAKLPKHVAIIMDGNGRWAKQRHLPRISGHQEGLKAVRRTAKACAEAGVEVLTLFAFGKENWQRPTQEVDFLMKLFLSALRNEIQKLHENNIKLRFIGDRESFSAELQQRMQEAEQLTISNTGLKLIIAADYSGQWDIIQAVRKLASEVEQGVIKAADITSKKFASQLSMADLPLPDLLIRTSGERRISNFLLWQLAYTELYFTDIFWPDFNEHSLADALTFYNQRERRFGVISEQLMELKDA